MAQYVVAESWVVYADDDAGAVMQVLRGEEQLRAGGGERVFTVLAPDFRTTEVRHRVRPDAAVLSRAPAGGAERYDPYDHD